MSSIAKNIGPEPRNIIRGWAGAARKVGGKSRTQLWRDVRNNRFPAPLCLGANSVGWFEDELDAWLESRPRRAYVATQTV